MTGSLQVEVTERIPVVRLQRFYRDHLGIDIDRFVEGLQEIRLYRCLSTGYEFYWPPSTAGDAAFYDSLSRHPWYYNPQRWEHNVASEWIGDAPSVLDVGCGSGSFLDLVRRTGPDRETLGLELSPRAVASARQQGLPVELRSLADHVEANPGAFAVVTAFQVLEHIPEPRPFIEGLLAAVAPGGPLIVGVPDNDGYLRETTRLLSYPLNMPPHHMGLWREGSLRRLPLTFELDIERLAREPLDRASLDRLAFARVANAVGGGKLAGLAWRAGVHRVYATLRRTALERTTGHTIRVAYRRRTR
jgi:SAM-dependent methyltransferase